MRKQKALLVEGEADQKFFEAFCRHCGYSENSIQVLPPVGYGAEGNGRGNAISLLPVLLKNIEDGRLHKLGIVVDADYKNQSNLGFKETFDSITAKLLECDYKLLTRRSEFQNGLRFANSENLPDIGVWIMPNNKDDGIFEDFLKICLSSSEQPLLNHASQSISTLPIKKFREEHLSKAEISTLLAWQQIPGKTFASIIGNNLFNPQARDLIRFTDWFQSIFQ